MSDVVKTNKSTGFLFVFPEVFPGIPGKRELYRLETLSARNETKRKVWFFFRSLLLVVRGT